MGVLLLYFLEDKKVICECGKVLDMVELNLFLCPKCNDAFYMHDEECGYKAISGALYSYIHAYQVYDLEFPIKPSGSFI